MLDRKAVLVTGGTGSLGNAFVKRAVTGEFGALRKLIVFSRDEAKQYDMRRVFPAVDYRIGDIRSYADVCSALREVDIVVNAAALKQVPSCEYFPEQAILTNCLGTQNIVRAIEEHRLPIQTVLTVSTDKACHPATVMGFTKALQERITIAANVRFPSTRFICVRYGNVLGSRGSVIPLFQEQIRNGGPMTITVPEMTRFLLTLDQAVDTMQIALDYARAGEIYVPRAPSATILNILKAMTEGLMVEVGIRPGEKLHEIMVSEEEAPRTFQRGSYVIIHPQLPELSCPRGPPVLKGEYSSRDSVLSLAETRALLCTHGFLP